MVIFTRTFDLLAWLLPHTNHFPRVHRHTVTQRLLDAALDLREFLEEAQLRRGPARQERLARADEPSRSSGYICYLQAICTGIAPVLLPPPTHISCQSPSPSVFSCSHGGRWSNYGF
jgi:hypothetical protein